ncbi:type II secretion system protein [Candidatus Azambacteria bacterium]|nr:type II secretion system protein [Candidatus Azambacteria bacterium]
MKQIIKYLNILKAKSYKLKAVNGFTLVESLVAIAIFTIGTSVALGSVTYALKVVPKIKSKVIAAHLAQEGIEIVRNIRDTSWISGEAWNTQLPESTGCVQYDKLNFDSACFGSTAPYLLKFDGTYYSHDVGVDSAFSRRITITYVSASEMKVQSQVTCTTGCDVLLEDHLFNWR